MAEERSARKAMHSKRQEIDALQSVISRVKSAASVDDIDSKVRLPAYHICSKVSLQYYIPCISHLLVNLDYA